MSSYCILGCSPKERSKHKHRFPSPLFPKIYYAWLDVIPSKFDKKNFDYRKYKVCDRHFEPEAKYIGLAQHRLTRSAIPTLHLPNPVAHDGCDSPREFIGHKIDGEVKELIKYEHSYAAPRSSNGELHKEDTIVDDTTLNTYENGVDTTKVDLTKLIDSYNIEETCNSDAEQLLSHLDVAEVTEIASITDNKENVASQDQNEIRELVQKSENISNCNLSSCDDLLSNKEECQNINTKKIVNTATTKYPENIIVTGQMQHVLDDANVNKVNISSAGFKRKRNLIESYNIKETSCYSDAEPLLSHLDVAEVTEIASIADNKENIASQDQNEIREFLQKSENISNCNLSSCDDLLSNKEECQNINTKKIVNTATTKYPENIIITGQMQHVLDDANVNKVNISSAGFKRKRNLIESYNIKETFYNDAEPLLSHLDVAEVTEIASTAENKDNIASQDQYEIRKRLQKSENISNSNLSSCDDLLSNTEECQNINTKNFVNTATTKYPENIIITGQMQHVLDGANVNKVNISSTSFRKKRNLIESHNIEETCYSYAEQLLSHLDVAEVAEIASTAKNKEYIASQDQKEIRETLQNISSTSFRKKRNLIESHNIEETCYSYAEQLLSHLDVAEVAEIASTAKNKEYIASQDQKEIRETLQKSEDIGDCNLSSCDDLLSDKEECQNINTKNTVSTATTKYIENIKTGQIHHILDDANANKVNKSGVGFRRNSKYLYYPIQPKSGRSAIISKQEISKISTLRKIRSIKAYICFDKYNNNVPKESQANLNQMKPLVINSMSSFNTQSNSPYKQSVSFDFAPFKYRDKVLNASLLLNLDNKDHNSLKFGGYNANLHQLGGKHSLQQSGCNTHVNSIGEESVREICDQANPESRSIPNDELCLSDNYTQNNAIIQDSLSINPDRHITSETKSILNDELCLKDKNTQNNAIIQDSLTTNPDRHIISETKSIPNDERCLSDINTQNNVIIQDSLTTNPDRHILSEFKSIPNDELCLSDNYIQNNAIIQDSLFTNPDRHIISESKSIPNDELCLSDIHTLDNGIQRLLCTSPDRHVSVRICEENCVNPDGPVSPKPEKLHVNELDIHVGSTTYVYGGFEPNDDEPVEDPLAIHSPNLGIKDSGALYEDSMTCSVENSINVVENHNVSNVEDNTCIIKDNMSSVEDNISNIEGNISDVEDNMSIIKDNISNAEDNISNIEGNISDVEDNMSIIKDNISNAEDNLSNAEGNFSDVEDNMRVIEIYMSNIENNISNVEGNLSNVEDSTSIKENMSTEKDNMSYKKDTRHLVDRIDSKHCIDDFVHSEECNDDLHLRLEIAFALKFMYKKDKTPKEAVEEIIETYGKGKLTLKEAKCWYHEFKLGNNIMRIISSGGPVYK